MKKTANKTKNDNRRTRASTANQSIDFSKVDLNKVEEYMYILL